MPILLMCVGVIMCMHGAWKYSLHACTPFNLSLQVYGFFQISLFYYGINCKNTDNYSVIFCQLTEQMLQACAG